MDLDVDAMAIQTDDLGIWWMYKTMRELGQAAQSVLNSLVESVLIVSLFNFWNWLTSRLNFGLNTYTTNLGNNSNNPPPPPPQQQQQQQSTFCINNNSSSKINQVSNLSNKESNQSSEMTIEVSTVSDAVVNPDHGSNSDQEDNTLISNDRIIDGKDHLTCSLPVLRLNSESFEDPLSEVDMFLEDFQDHDDQVLSSASEENVLISNRRHGEDSCSDYCSGSGSSPGSPTPNQIESVVLDKTTNFSRRDSDTSDSSVNNDKDSHQKDGQVPPEVVSKIIFQVETMFSDDHLAKDGFLLKHVRRRSDGFVSLKLVAGLRKVKQLSREFSTVLVALQQSDKLEVNAEGTKIRRKEPLTTNLKSLPIKQAKKEKSQSEKENQGIGSNSSADEMQVAFRTSSQSNKENIKTVRNPNQKNNPNNGANIGNANRRNSSNQGQTSEASRKNSNVSTASSNGTNSRNNSFSSATGRPHPADLFRHVMNSRDESGEDTSQVIRRRGGSLPINTGHRGSIGGYNLSPSNSPPNLPGGFLRPKSNSYCEGTNPPTTTMSPWLLRRKASASSRTSSGDIVISGVIRQPKGPDGTKGFQIGYREIILKERLQITSSESSTFSA